MEISTPVLAAIVAGVISLFINSVSLVAQYILNERHEKKMIRARWRRETISLIKELRREAHRINLPNSNIEPLEELIHEIERQRNAIPPKYQNSDIDNKLGSLILCQERYTDSIDGKSIPQYRHDIIEKAEHTLDSFGDLTQEADSLY